MILVTNPLGQIVSRFVDAAGRVLSLTNPLGQTIRHEDDALNRLTRVTDPLQGVTQFSYDPNGNLLSLTDARSNVTSYAYNNMDRVQTRTDPLNHAESYQYNQNGNLTQHTDRKSQVTNYTYDSLDRPSQVTYADSSTVPYTYDGVSRLTQVTDSISGTISFTYDNLDRLLSETTPQGTVSYTYDGLGRRVTMSVPGQSQVTYSYDNGNRLTQITQGTSTVSFAYDNDDRRTSLTLPNGVVTEYSYNTASQLIGLTYKKAGNTLGNLTYEYDSAGRRVRVGGSFARTNLPAAVASASYNAANQQTGFGGQTLSYDLNGNLTGDGTNTYTWNTREQLVAIAGGVAASFQYDAIGRRRSKTIGSTSTSFSYDGDNVVQEQSGGTANLLSAGLDEFFTRSDASGTTSLIADALGSTVALTDSAGAVQTQYTYEPFGNASVSGTASNNPSQYTGRENDGTAVFYYRARYYSPSRERFISEDPIGFIGGINHYAYVDNDPGNSTDPFGLQDDGRDWSKDPAVGHFFGTAPPLGGRKNDDEVEICRFLGVVGTFSAGFADHIDFGFSEAVRDWTGASDAVDKNHPSYDVGTGAGYAWDVGMAVAAPARAAGHTVDFNYYRNAKGVGMTVLKKGERCFGIDWHRFKLKSTGQIVNRPHGHWGPTKSQIGKHRSLRTGKPM